MKSFAVNLAIRWLAPFVAKWLSALVVRLSITGLIRIEGLVPQNLAMGYDAQGVASWLWTEFTDFADSEMTAAKLPAATILVVWNAMRNAAPVIPVKRAEKV